MRLVVAFLLALFTSTLAAQSAPKGIWLSPAEIQTLPDSGKEWDAMKAVANGSWSTPDLSNQDSKANTQVLAGAYVAVRTNSQTLRDRVRAAVAKIPASVGGRTLALGRELPAYVIAIDLVGWRTAVEETTFKSWLKAVRTVVLDGKTLVSTHEVRPNNWGTQAGFALAVIDVYLDDAAGLARVATVHRGWLGDRGAYSNLSVPGFDYGDLDWQANKAAPVGINPKGSTISGHSVDGALPEEMRRGGGFEWPAPCENYAWTGLTPSLCTSWVLGRWGYPDVFTWSDSAQLRAMKWLHVEASCPATGNDVGTSWLANSVYKETFRVSLPTEQSREIAWLGWTHAKTWSTLPDPGREDFQAAFSFQFVEDSKTWTVNTNPTNSWRPGAGATPAAALNDWTIKNPEF